MAEIDDQMMEVDPASLEDIDPASLEESSQSVSSDSPDSSGFIEVDPSQLEDYNGGAIEGIEVSPLIDGSSPDAAIPISPLTVRERFGISLDSRAGALRYLREKYKDDVRENEDGDLVVNHEGRWHLIDGKAISSETSDPWTTAKRIARRVAFVGTLGQSEGLISGKSGMDALNTEMDLQPLKEGASEIAENAITVAGIGTGIAAGTAAATLAPVTGGASLVAVGAAAGAASSLATTGLKSSLGRIVGTYRATPEEELTDAGFDLGMSIFFGGMFPPGVKPTPQHVAKGLSKAAEAAAEMAPQEVGTLMKATQFITGVSDDVVEVFTKDPKELARESTRLASMSKGNHAELIKQVDREVIQNTESALTGISNFARDTYRTLNTKMLKEVPRDFVGSADELAIPHIKTGISDGYISVVKDGKEIAGDAAQELVEKSGGSLLGFEFKVNKAAAKKFGDAISNRSELDDEILSKFYSGVVNLTGNTRLTGRAAVNKMMEAKKSISDLSWNAKQAIGQNKSQAEGILARDHAMVNSIIDKRFAWSDSYKKINPTYSKMAELVKSAGLPETTKKMDKLLSKEQGIRTVAKRFASDTTQYTGLLDLTTEMGRLAADAGVSTDGLKAVNQSIYKNKVLKSVIETNPLIRKDLVSGIAGLGAAERALNGSITGAASVATLGLARSPRLARSMWLPMTKHLQDTAQVVRQLAPRQLQTLRKTPGAMTQLMMTPIRAARTEEETRRALLDSAGFGEGQ